MNTTMTSGQLGLQLKVFDEKGMTPDRWQSILSSGIFADLCDPNANLDDRDSVRKALKLGVALPESFTLSVDYSRSLDQMIAAGHYDWKNDDITANKFPVQGSGVEQFEAKVFHFDRNISSEKAIESMTCSAVWEPAKIEHLLAFGAKYPEEQRKYPIVALGSVAELYGGRGVPCLGEGVRVRYLDLDWWDDDWVGRCRFLAVRKLSSVPVA